MTIAVDLGRKATKPTNNLCKQIGPRSGPSKHWAWSGSNLIILRCNCWKNFSKKLILKKKQQTKKKAWKKITRRQRVKPVAPLNSCMLQKWKKSTQIFYLLHIFMVVSLIPAQPHTFLEFDRVIFSTVNLLPMIQERLFSVTSKRICMVYWLTA